MQKSGRLQPLTPGFYGPELVTYELMMLYLFKAALTETPNTAYWQICLTELPKFPTKEVLFQQVSSDFSFRKTIEKGVVFNYLPKTFFFQKIYKPNIIKSFLSYLNKDTWRLLQL